VFETNVGDFHKEQEAIRRVNMTTKVTTKVHVNHVFDKRAEFSIRDLRAGRSKVPIRCLKCKQLVQDPDSSCSFVQKEEDGQ
jgi:hypothetical protein